VGDSYTVEFDPLDLMITVGGRTATVTLHSCVLCGALVYPDNTRTHTRYHANRREGTRRG